MEMLTRFQEQRLLLGALERQKLICDDQALAKAIADVGQLRNISQGEILIEEGTADNGIFLVIYGAFSVLVKGKKVAVRGVCDHLGEMAAIDPSQPRTSTVVADEDSVVFCFQEPDFSKLSEEHPVLWKNLAIELSKRLIQRNDRIDPANSQISIFIVSSVEALPIAQEIQSILSHDSFSITVWTDGVFRASSYPIESLENALDQSDFAIVIAQPDDEASVRGADFKTPRDNVNFELGLAIGRLKDCKRVFLLEPRGEAVKLPSDLLGLITIRYQNGDESRLPSLLAPACHEIRKNVKQLGIRE
ncbi:MAG: TIR domain-containing protein [Vampirovibrionales bacterium]|nr:TIR domain-containing protein [Vampirovibrionales bacterium]